MMKEKLKMKVLSGRDAVDKYRAAHHLLYSGTWHKDIPKKHTPLLEQMLIELSKQGFESLQDFSQASEQLNIEAFGISSGEASPELLKGMWL